MGSAICGSAKDTATHKTGPTARPMRLVPQDGNSTELAGVEPPREGGSNVNPENQTGPITYSFVARKSEQPEVNYEELRDLWRMYNNIRRKRLDNEVFISVVDGVVQHARRRRTQEITDNEFTLPNGVHQPLDPLVVEFIRKGSGYEYQSDGKFLVKYSVCDHQLHGIITFLDQAKHHHATPLFVFHQQVLGPIDGVDDNVPTVDVDDMIRVMLQNGQLPSSSSILQMLICAKRLLRDEPNVVTVPAPCVLVGDIHGQFYDLRDRVIAYGGPVENTRYVFLGDYVDRGENSLLCATLLMTLKVRYPNNVFLLRGNHESKMTNNIYGFQQECRTTFPELSQGILMEHPMWASFNNAFDLLPLMAIVGNRVLCMHGGLSPEFQTPAHVMTVDRGVEIEANQLMSDITWSDPTPSDGFYGNLRGLGHLFGPDVTHHVLRINHMSMLVRAHQCVKSGFQFDHSELLVTLFSAPNYCNLGNKGAILSLDAALNMTFTVYDPAPKQSKPQAQTISTVAPSTPVVPDVRQAPPYFWDRPPA
eukprot:PhF_6_TR10228/c0_g1_i1/m.15852